MATAEMETTQAVVYSVTDTKLSELRDRFTGLTADTPNGYRDCRDGIAACRTLRVEVEKKRVELKADALAYGRKVDSEAKRITALLLEIEEPLKLAKQEVDDEKDRIRREKEEAERAKVEAQLKAAREAEEAKARAEREAEAAKLAEERKRLEEEGRKLVEARKAEQARVDAEHAKLAAAQKAEQERIDAERRKINVERQAVEAQQAKLKAEQEAREKIEREHAEAERRKKEEELAAVQHAKQIEALKPDKEKIHTFVGRLCLVEAPFVKTAKAKTFMAGIIERLQAIKTECEQF